MHIFNFFIYTLKENSPATNLSDLENAEFDPEAILSFKKL
jgi:hypothetical protein